MILLLNTIGIVGGVLIVTSFIPQIKLILTTKNAEGNSLSFWKIISLGITCAAISMIGMNVINGVAFTVLGMVNEVTQILNASLAITTLYLVRKYSKLSED